jgi:glycine cleavage system aminomethyltransferase T
LLSSGRPIALALLSGGRQQLGKQVSVHDGSDVTHAEVVATPFYDTAAERMNA